MLYKFKSKVTGDVIMLQAHGEHLLGLIGKHRTDAPSTRGILLPADMPAARAALEAAIVLEESQRQQALDDARTQGLPTPRFDGIGLRQRSHPLVQMMTDCQRADEPIVWGV